MCRAVVWLGLAGCLRIADFQPPASGDGGLDADPNTPPAPVTAMVKDGAVVVTGSFFELKFGSAGAHFPDSLTIGGAPNLLARSESCEQSGMGIQLDPGFIVDAVEGSGPAPEIIYSGGAVAQVRVPWTQNWTCDNGSNTASGTSTFTVYPEGRIVRHDDIQFQGAMMVATAGCACNNVMSTSFRIRAYTTLRDDAFPVVPEPNGGDGSPVELVGTSTQVCASTPAHSVLYGFENEWARLRKIPQRPNGFAHALSYDVFVQSTIQNVGDATVSTMLLSAAPGTCGPLAARMLALRNDVAIGVEDPAQPGVPVPLTASPVHGIYELPTPATFVRDRVELRTATATVVPSGFVVKLKFAGPRSRVTTSLPVSSYLVAHPAPDVALIYILATLDAATPVTVVAEP